MLTAITFLQPNDLNQSFEKLTDYLPNVYNGDADDLLEYFKDTYIGRYRRNVSNQAFQFSSVTCSKEQKTNCPAQITA